MAPFYGWGSTASRLEPLRGGSLLFTTKFPEGNGKEKKEIKIFSMSCNLLAKSQLVLVITCLGGQFGINCPSVFLNILILPE